MELTWKQSALLCITLGMLLAANTSMELSLSSFSPMNYRLLNEKTVTPISMGHEAYWIYGPLWTLWAVVCIGFAMGSDLGSGDDEFQSQIISLLTSVNVLSTLGSLALSNGSFLVAWVFFALNLSVLYRIYVMLERVLEQPLIKFDKLTLGVVSSLYYFSLFTLAVETTMALPILGYLGSYAVLAAALSFAVEQGYVNKDPIALFYILYVGYFTASYQAACGDRVALAYGSGTIVEEPGLFDF
jgi:hypothetical protein